MNHHAEAIAAAAARLARAPGTAPLPSPCVSVCRMDDATGYCEGCLRTIDEIMAWGALDEPARRAVWRLLAQRAQAALGGSTDRRT